MTLFDTHCHLMDEQFSDDVDLVIQGARAAGVKYIVVPAIDVVTARRAIAIAERYEGVYAAVGIHPESAKDVPACDFDEVERLAAHQKVVAIGEIGLDYYWDAAPRPEQQAVLRRQIELAKRVDLPIIIHNRESTKDVVDVLRDAGAAEVGGVMHCFNETLDVAEKCMALGFYISFGGPVTFKKAEDVREVAAQIPDDRILIETDSPYLSPHPFRGKRNEPARVRLVAEQIAQVRGVDVDVLAAQTTANALALFRGVKPYGE
ncbi:TatD family hydrolase [Alicyclobacillus fastidiosus]|uniref:TatD family hydrolase n=1 Tax=Alicyclobacillus fastidiosus TaxID=392011 RepID=A0ABY6ZHI0_9BACL|nr:TatD family hydrolase [Alicyclobacillus fastidiosus]WAH42190.1 TatD family hydrolase [Alicyclobacillus fastidiosus]GMA63981.1 hydrolase TatD [Alicyclobacillus fastidiosus]